MSSPLKQRLRLLASVLSLLVLLAAGAGTWFYFQLRGSLPKLDGTQTLPGISAAVTVTRDDLGVPTVKAATRLDAAQALGFLHAQDRFFQMDLLRRRAAGELAALFGEKAVPADRLSRPHHFRELAGRVLASLPPARRALLDRYTAGVNAGLAALGRKPFEYVVLRAEPAPWRDEDSILVIYAMALDLLDADGSYEHSLSTISDKIGPGVLDFFAPVLLPGDAALDGTTGPAPQIPSARLIDVRAGATAVATPIGSDHAFADAASAAPDASLRPGSNSFALAGAHTATGAALLANDPHLSLRLPNVWYRAVLEWHDSAAHRLVGVTLPGLPLLVIGSNGHIAWGLTNSYADVGDLVAVDINPISHNLYKVRGRDDLLEIQHHHDVITVKGGADVTVDTDWTDYGQIVGLNAKERPLAWHWTFHDPAAVNLESADLETATDVASAVAIAHRSGIPPQNFLVADEHGDVAWTITGRLPRRVGFDGRLPVSWLYGDRQWNGFLPPDEVPTLTTHAAPNATAFASAPAVSGGRFWTANNRLVGGDALALLGDGNYDGPPRAAQIRDDLAKLDHATPRDLLGVQLDDRALFLARWQKLLLDTLTPEAVAAKKTRGAIREQVGHWEGHASVDSVSYRLVRAFRLQVAKLVFTPVFASCVETQHDFDWHRFNYDDALWAIVSEKPMHLLDARFADWQALLLAAVDGVTDDLDHEDVAIAHATWGRRNTLDVNHPIGGSLPRWLGGWMNLEPVPLPGDSNMPRVQSPDFGASMRLVVSPGHEDEGLFEMPGGQSGHPLSPYYRAGTEAWEKGDPAPLLPGKTTHTLTLTP